MRTPLPLALAACLLTLAPACGPTGAATPDAGTDAPASLDAGALPDAFVAPVDAPRCDLSPVPSPLPMLEGVFLVEGPTTMPPETTGGDPTGTWVFERVSFYVSSTAGEMFDAEMSTVGGTAWAAFDGTEARLEMELALRLADTVGGDVSRNTRTRIRGAYTAVGDEVTFTPSCLESPMMMPGGAAPTFGISVEGDRGVLVIRSVGMLGPTTIVLEGARVP